MKTGKLHVKVCGMKFSSNREQLEMLPIDLFGFIFYPPSPRYIGGIDVDKTRALMATAKWKAGVFVNAGINQILQRASLLGLTHIQLHGNESPGDCMSLRMSGLQVIKAFRVDKDFDFGITGSYADKADYFLFDTRAEQPGGTGRKFDWKILEEYMGNTPFFLSGGIGPGDASAIRQFRHPALYGIDLNSGFEIVPGQKDPELLQQFLLQLGL